MNDFIEIPFMWCFLNGCWFLDSSDHTSQYQPDSNNGILYCSACLMPCSIRNFYTHIAKDHKGRSKPLSWGSFSTPVLLPINHVDFPKEAAEPLEDYTHQTEIQYSESEEGKAKPNPCAFSREQKPKSASYDCHICNASYVKYGNLDRHLRYSHRMELITSQPVPNAMVEGATDSISAEDGSGLSSTITPHKKSNGITTINPADLPDEFDPDFFCRVCDRKYVTVSAFRIHIRRVHNIRLQYDTTKPIRHPDITPDLEDPTLYCGACERQFLNGKTYIIHLKYIHYMTISSSDVTRVSRRVALGPSMKNDEGRIKRRSRVDTSIIPDHNDPTSYCESCDRRYPESDGKVSKRKLISHLSKVHGYSTKAGVTYRCVLCAEILETRDQYSTHLQQSHKKRLAKLSSINDFTCQLCQTEYIRKTDLFNHLVNVHKLKPAKEFPLKPKSAARKVFGCTLCNKRFSGRFVLGGHMKLDHGVVYKYDSVKHFCNLCNTSSRSETNYREHLVLEHRIGRFPNEGTEIETIYDYDDISDEDAAHTDKSSETDSDYSMTSIRKRTQRKASQKMVTRSSKANKIQAFDKSHYVSDRGKNISKTSTTHCQICNLTYNSVVHYRLHCFKYHKF